MNNSAKTIKEYTKLIEEKLSEYNMKDEWVQKSLTDAIAYSIEAGGKRIRPILTLEFCRICDGEINSALTTACAIEMLHTFSLIHDDLPCMDNDDIRRGIPSCHRVFGEDIALIAGDALSIRSFEIIARSVAKREISAETAVRLIADISDAVGAYGMCGGQVLDLENEHRIVDEHLLYTTHRLKTGALISIACKAGAIVAGASEAQIKAAALYGEKLGMAFQIIDDILDVEGSEELTGKPSSSDKEQNKTTFVTLYGIDKSKELARQLSNDAINLLDNFYNNTFLVDLTKALLMRNK